MKALISDIKRFAVHDGDGIRTTVFLKGCPLRCVWCHNPESISSKPQLGYYENKCISCGECVTVCPNDAHEMVDGNHIFRREKCKNCGKCAERCLGQALVFYGREMTVDELLPLLLEDKNFYDNSGGGVTISGGECLMQVQFCAELLKQLKEHGINTAVDTCGFVNKETLDRVIPYTDTFLYDIKAMDEEVHIKCTGQSNKQILENIKYLDSRNCCIEVRIPYVPQHNDKEITEIAKFLDNIHHLKRVKLLPYHNYAGSRYLALGMENTLPVVLPTEEELQQKREELEHGR